MKIVKDMKQDEQRKLYWILKTLVAKALRANQVTNGKMKDVKNEVKIYSQNDDTPNVFCIYTFSPSSKTNPRSWH